MKRIFLAIVASILLFCGCQKTQCKNTIYNACFYHVTTPIYINGKLKYIDANQKINAPFGAYVVLDGKNYKLDDCGRSWMISDRADGSIYMQ